ncbi:unnamed protein product [Effrenium voratum]|uniref:Uncharacterized protein n=1 Tax=Effrenium voratum TaxID=2562239 RepID=A0AA36JGY8_9DINO|nr:unnamed protein product [Effrenium voratum]
MEKFSTQAQAASSNLANFVSQQERVRKAVDTKDLSALEKEHSEGKAEADPFGVRAWWRQTCPETVRQLSQIQAEQKTLAETACKMEADTKAELQELLRSPSSLDSKTKRLQDAQKVRADGLEKLKEGTKELAEVVDDGEGDMYEILAKEGWTDQMMSEEQMILAHSEVQARRDRNRFRDANKAASDLLKSGQLPPQLGQVHDCLAKAQEAKEISAAATTSKVKAQERLDYLKGYIADTRRYIEDPLRASRDKAMDDVDEARLLAEKAMASLRSALQTLSERSRINEALYLQEAHLKEQLFNAEEQLLQAGPAFQQAEAAGDECNSKACAAANVVEREVEATARQLKSLAQPEAKFALGQVLRAQELLDRLEKDKEAEIRSLKKALETNRQEANSFAEARRHGGAAQLTSVVCVKNSQKKKLENSLGVCEQELSEVKEAAARAQNQKKAFLDLRGGYELEMDSQSAEAKEHIKECYAELKLPWMDPDPTDTTTALTIPCQDPMLKRVKELEELVKDQQEYRKQELKEKQELIQQMAIMQRELATLKVGDDTCSTSSWDVGLAESR